MNQSDTHHSSSCCKRRSRQCTNSISLCKLHQCLLPLLDLQWSLRQKRSEALQLGILLCLWWGAGDQAGMKACQPSSPSEPSHMHAGMLDPTKKTANCTLMRCGRPCHSSRHPPPYLCLCQLGLYHIRLDRRLPRPPVRPPRLPAAAAAQQPQQHGSVGDRSQQALARCLSPPQRLVEKG